MNILLTGSAGFIGSHLGPLLKKNGHSIYGYDLESLAKEDIRDVIKLDKVFSEEGFDMVIHLAARAGVLKSKEFPADYITTNVFGTQCIIDMCEKYEVRNFIFFSSSSVLGGLNRAANELDVYNPKSLYAISKMAGECIVLNSSLNSLIVRPFSVYGENGRRDMVIYKWINEIKQGKYITAYGHDGETRRGYTYVGDLVEAIVKIVNDFSNIRDKIMKNHNTIKKIPIIHLGGSEIIKIKDLLSIFGDFLLKKKLELRAVSQPLMKEDVPSSFADTTLAKEVLGFDPKPQFKKVVEKILKKEFTNFNFKKK